MKLRRGNAFNDDLSIDKTGRRFAITHNPHPGCVVIVGVRKIEPVIRSKLRMQGDTHQSAFAARLDIGDDEQGLRAQLSIFKDAHPARSLGKEHPPIRRPHDRPDNLQIRNYRFNLEAGLG